MKPRFCHALLLAWILVPSSQLAAQQEDPVKYCNEHPDESKCIVFKGGQSQFYSRSGNVGSTDAAGATTNNRYVVFLHDGGASTGSMEQLTNTLRTRGYVVRGVAHDVDAAGGPGVDYFYEQDKSTAANVADIINAGLPRGSKPLEPRFQKVKNPPGVLGVWLAKPAAPGGR